MNKKPKYFKGNNIVLMAYLHYMQFFENLIELDLVDSTNNYALEALKQNRVQHGTCIFTHHQYAGKGQMGKQWLTNVNENITISIIIDVNSPVFLNPFSLMAFSGAACCLFLREYTQLQSFVKWPNDIFINDKKAGGILIETTKVNNKKIAVIGIGLNINTSNFSKTLKNATSLKQITAQEYNLLEVTKKLWEYIFNFLPQWHQFTKSEILACYNNLLYKKNEVVKLKKGNIITTGTVNGVNEHGELQLSNALWDSCVLGTVEWIFD